MVTHLWSDEWTYDAWLEIERQVLDAQRRHEVIPADAASELISRLRKYHFDIEAAGKVRAIERVTKHDVAAFLQYIRDNEVYGQWLHYGLTSSDLVDTAQGMRFRELHRLLLHDLGELMQQVGRWTGHDIPMVGRTHGQPAEPTSMRARAWNWLATLELPITTLTRVSRQLQVAKLSGPVGTFAHNPPMVEAEVAVELHLRPMGAGASQIVPRSALAMFASTAAVLAQACSKIAMDLRLMNLAGEVWWTQSDGQVGSSAMAHKNNPIVAEQIRGLAQLVGGYAQMLQPLDLWLERDISNSSVERVAVPDLLHVLFRLIAQTTEALRTMEVKAGIATINLADNANSLWVHKETLAGIADGYDWNEARDLGKEVQVESYDIAGDARWFMRNYPQAPR
jgi:adenylosuccinate lyase